MRKPEAWFTQRLDLLTQVHSTSPHGKAGRFAQHRNQMSDPRGDLQPTIAAIGEHGLIDRVRARVPCPPAWVTIGIGDDAAVIEPARGELDVVTTDGLVEDVHFRRAWTTSRAIGHKALAVNLSDLAAMGASPRAAVLNLALPADLLLADFDELIDGFLALAGVAGVPLVGGNITRSPGPMVVGVTLIGTARRRRILTRAGARHGDDVYVTGRLGGAATGLAVLREGRDRGRLSAALTDAVMCLEQPQPRLRTGVSVARNRAASACVDLSDGLADAIGQLARASGVGAILDAALLPIHVGTAEWAESSRHHAALAAVTGGEDYELLFAVPPKRRSRFRAATRTMSEVPVTRIGQLTREMGLWLDVDGRREPLGPGFRHF